MKRSSLFPKAAKQPSLARALPTGPALSLRRTWLLVDRPRIFGDHLRERFGDAAALFARAGMARRVLHGEVLVVVLSPAGARQVFSSEPDGYDAIWREGFSGVAGERSI